MRLNGRRRDALRPVQITRDFTKYAEGSVLIEMGDTKIIATATTENRVPHFLRNQGKGWVTAEYAMLPRSCSVRTMRDSVRGKIGGRTHEIQRFIGRSLRAVMDLDRFGERSILMDCDVIQADGGTRTAAVTGAFVALVDALRRLKQKGEIETVPLVDSLAAVSVGKVNGEILLDLDYEEDSTAAVDMNVVMTGKGDFVEVQVTAEQRAFPQEELDQMLKLASKGIKHLIAIQKEILGALK